VRLTAFIILRKIYVKKNVKKRVIIAIKKNLRKSEFVNVMKKGEVQFKEIR